MALDDDRVFSSIVLITVEESAEKFAVHEVLLTAASHIFRRALSAKPADASHTRTIPLQKVPLETLRIFCQWLYTGDVPIESELLLHYQQCADLGAPAFRNALVDRFADRLKKGLDTFPEPKELTLNVANSNIMRVFRDVCIWELNEDERDETLKPLSRDFERDFWKEHVRQKPSPGARAPYSEGLHCYHEQIGDLRPLYPERCYSIWDWKDISILETKCLRVGVEREKYYVHDEVLKSCSDYFRTSNHSIELPFVEVKTVQIFLTWLYFGKISQSALGAIRLLLDCYFLGDRLLIPSFTNATIKSILFILAHQLSGPSEGFPTPSEVHEAYVKTKKGAPLRQLLVDIHVWDEASDVSANAYPPEFLTEYEQGLEHLDEKCNLHGVDILDNSNLPWLADPERYLVPEKKPTLPSNESVVRSETPPNGKEKIEAGLSTTEIVGIDGSLHQNKGTSNDLFLHHIIIDPAFPNEQNHYQTISAMHMFRVFSLEELRLADYNQERKIGSQDSLSPLIFEKELSRIVRVEGTDKYRCQVNFKECNHVSLNHATWKSHVERDHPSAFEILKQRVRESKSLESA